jgi:O-antigen/teichoic acid export membrane protein
VSNKANWFITHWLQSSFILICFLVALWMKELFSILVKNPELTQYYDLGIIIIMGYSYRPYYWASVNRLIYSENTSQLWKISFIAGVVNVILNLIFIPLYGIMAAAISTFISLIYVGFSGFYLKSYKENETEKYHPAWVIVIITLSTVLVFLMRYIQIHLKWILTLVLPAVYLLYWYKQRKGFRQISW